MNCMKCGRETAGDNAFCPTCLEQMQRYPVKPGTAVVLPSREESKTTKKSSPRKKSLTAEEINLVLKRRNRRLAYLLIVAVVVIGLMGVLSGHVIKQLGVQKFLGQNYSTIVSTTPSETVSETTPDSTAVPAST